MEQAELQELYMWGSRNIQAFEVEQVDESTHYYMNNELIGGFAGDTQQFFYLHTNEFDALLERFSTYLLAECLDRMGEMGERAS